MEEAICRKCKQRPFAESDKRYLQLFNICWDCDKKYWEQGLMSTEEFERREKMSLNRSLSNSEL